MKTTFAEIYKCDPHVQMWDRLCDKTNQEKNMSKEITLLDILNNSTLYDFFWSLRTQDYRDYCLMLKQIVEPFTEQYKNFCFPYGELEKALEAIQLWHDEKIDDYALNVNSRAAILASKIIGGNPNAIARCVGYAAENKDSDSALHFYNLMRVYHNDNIGEIEKIVRKFLEEKNQ